MDPQVFLNSVRKSLLQVEVLCDRAEKLREMAIQAGSSESQESFVIELMDTHAELQVKVSKFLTESHIADQLIETLDNGNQRAVLQLRYLCGYNWNEIAKKIGYTLHRTHKLHATGITELERKYKNGSSTD